MTPKQPTMSNQPTDAMEVSLDDWRRSVDAFTRMIDRLQADYAELEARHSSLNAELAAVNETLRATAEDNRQLAAYLDRIVAGVTSGIVAVDAGGVIHLFNPAAAHLLGIPPQQVVNRHYFDVWPERSSDAATAAACAAGADPVTNVRREISCGGVSPLVLSVSTVRLEAQTGGCPPDSRAALGGAIEVFSDVTRLETMQAEMVRMRTLAALGEMSATIAHEIRNPLGGITGFAELLARRLENDPQRREMTEKILAGAQHLNSLVERLLEFAREPRVDLRPVEWSRFFHTTIDQFEAESRRRGARLTFIRHLPEHLPTGHADGLCLRQAIWNVLENAEHATDGRGTVEVAAEPLAGGIRLRISDNGAGVDPKIADRVFSPFITTKNKGTGLGLATSKKFVEAHGGTIAIESRPGAGTTVQLDLPCHR
jgi:signal transduction histidine kinase